MAISAFLAAQGFFILDGGLATELEARGADLRDPLWSAKVLIESPHLVESVNFDYLAAGADVAVTASYQATIPGLISRGFTRAEAENVIRSSVDVSRAACDRFWSEVNTREGRQKPLVAASIGPYGAFLHDGSEYRGNYGLNRDQLKAFHRDRLAILADSGADLIAFESFPSQLEAEAVVELMEEFPGTSCWVSFTCKDEESICEGTTFGAAVKAIGSHPQVAAVGLNCTSPRWVASLLRSAQGQCEKPLLAYPNSGELYDVTSGRWLSQDEMTGFDSAAVQWFKAGARLIGGCCRTTPATIRSVRAALTGAISAAGTAPGLLRT